MTNRRRSSRTKCPLSLIWFHRRVPPPLTLVNRMLGARDLESDRNVERGAEMRLKLILRDGRITKRAGRRNRSPRGGEALEPHHMTATTGLAVGN